MGLDPTASISCTTYNHANFIKKCLEGFLMQQTSFEFEILIHDDASTDETQDIIKAYQQKHPTIIKPIFQTENQYSKGARGIMPRFNFPRAQGKYIALCEGDDYWTDPLKLQKQVDFLEENEECSFCFTKARKVFEGIDKASKIYPEELKKTIYTATEYLDFTTTATCSLVFKNFSKINNISFPVLPHLQGDFILYCHLLHHGKAGALDEVTSVYRKHPQGISYNNNAKDYLFRRIEQLKVEKNYFTFKEVKAAIDKQYVLHTNRFFKLYSQDLEKTKYLKKQLFQSRYFYYWMYKRLKKKTFRKLKSFL